MGRKAKLGSLPPGLDVLAKEMHEKKRFGDEMLLLQTIARIRRLEAVKEPVCVWRESVDVDDDYWATQCGEKFQWTTGTPEENGAKFCLYCGGKIEVKR